MLAITNARFLPVEYMAAILTAFSGFWLLSPWYHPTLDPAPNPAITAFGDAVSVFLLVLGLLNVAVLLATKWPRRWQFRRFFTMAMFIIYLFLSLLRAFTYGPSQIVWISILFIALTEALAYLALTDND